MNFDKELKETKILYFTVNKIQFKHNNGERPLFYYAKNEHNIQSQIIQNDYIFLLQMQLLSNQRGYKKTAEVLEKSAITIQKNWRRYQARKIFNKLLKRQKKRKFIAKQMLQTQRSYCRNLNLVIKDILIPSKMVVEGDMHKILFSNIQQIYDIHKVFLDELDEVMKNYHPNLSRISVPIKDCLINKEGFKQNYTKYCSSYKRIDQAINFLKDNNQGLHEVLKKAGVFASSLSLESYMIKPVQRICKYGLLIDDYFKNMQKEHCDYNEIGSLRNTVDKLVKQTNDEVEEYLMNQRYRQVRNFFPTFFAKIPNNVNRKLFYESKPINLINIIKESSYNYRSCMVFSDCLVLLPKYNEEPIIIPYLFVRDIGNLKYFRNMIQIITNGQYFYIEFRQDKHRQQFMGEIMKKTKYMDTPSFKDYIKVTILGTQTRQSFFSAFTVYIVQIDQKGDTTVVYPRFKDLLKVQQTVIENGMKFQAILLFKQSPYLTLKSKTIEKRKLTIQEFLQRVLNTGFKNDVMDILGLQQTFLAIDKKSSIEEIYILLPNMQKIKLFLPVYSSKVKNVKSLVFEHIGMQECSQFQIFEVKNRIFENKKLVYEDEPLTKIYDSQQQNITSFNPFRDILDYVFTRHYYLSQQKQMALYVEDPSRAELELAVIHLSLGSLKLEEEVLLTFMCLFAIYIKLAVEDKDKLQLYVDELTKKNFKVGKEDFRYYYEEVNNMLIVEPNMLVSVPLLAIKTVSNNLLYQCQQFAVELHQKSISQVKTIVPNVQEKMILGFKPEKVYFLSSTNRTLIKQFTYEDFHISETHPNALVIKLFNYDTSIVLKTILVYEVVSLFQIYKKNK